MNIYSIPFDIASTALSSLISLPDPEAASALNDRILAWNMIDKLHERSYVERGLIAIQFEKKQLWKYLIDPDVGQPFENFTAWMSCTQFLGCRRTNFEAKADLKELADVPSEKLLSVKKDNIKVLKKLSTSVRKQDDVLEAAKVMSREKFEEKVEREHPDQHIESRKPLYLMPGRSDRKIIDAWISYALKNDIASSPTEAVVRACEIAMSEKELEDELRSMPAEDHPLHDHHP